MVVLTGLDEVKAYVFVPALDAVTRAAWPPPLPATRESVPLLAPQPEIDPAPPVPSNVPLEIRFVAAGTVAAKASATTIATATGGAVFQIHPAMEAPSVPGSHANGQPAHATPCWESAANVKPARFH